MYEAAAPHEQDATLRFNDSLAAAQAYAQAQKTSDAERNLRAAMNTMPGDPRPYAGLITTVYGPARDESSAARITRSAIANGVDAAPLYLALEEAAGRAGDAKLAETALHEAVNATPSFSNWKRFGSFYMEQGKYARASDSIHRALQLNPQSGEAYFLLAQAEEGVYQYPAARAGYERAVALAPDHPELKTRSLDLAHRIAEDARNSQ